MPPTTPPLTLVILAAGRSTRFGRLKQLTPIGHGGEALLDYALYDAALAGFSRFLLVIQEDLQADFDAHLHPAATAGLDLRYAYQSLSHPGHVDTPPPGRTRPWGTGHAVLTAAEQVDGPFAMCNADDFYGRSAYAALAAAMRGVAHHDAPTPGPTAAAHAAPSQPGQATPSTPATHSTPATRAIPTPALTVGYPLSVTLSESGGVSRGLCQVDKTGALQKLTEGLGMRRDGNRVRGRDVAGRPLDVPLDTPVCTNLWGFPEIPDVGSASEAPHSSPDSPTSPATAHTPHRDRFPPESVPKSVTGILSHLKTLFSEFLHTNPGTDSEYYLSEAMNELIARGLVHCRVLPTDETWLGVTFPGDHAGVAETLRTLVDSKVYPRRLWDSPPSTSRD
ncbi:MAG: NTP transferase domain-containing protein [Gemmatimonadota bacterium]|nr:NTP transferase domain-containing protein [Gemmatimonadota bacterium]MDE2983310.1 NTP transferase domain-containing protein [Gemmatimonadota bacterium]